MTAPYQELALAKAVPALRFHYVDCDVMRPTYNVGDWLIFMPVDDFQFDAVYIVDNGFGFPSPYRVDCGAPKGHFRMYRDNPVLSKTKESVSREWFREHVYGLVVGSMRLPHRLTA